MIVLLHGLGETMRCWDRVVPLLTDRFRCVLVDLPGFGGSDGGGRGATIDDLAGAVAETVDTRGVVAGHSLGGAVGVALAERSRRSWSTGWCWSTRPRPTRAG